MHPRTPGVYIGGHHGHYGTAEVVHFAIGRGMPTPSPDDLKVLQEYGDRYHEPDYDFETLGVLADKAEAWLNDAQPLDGHYWGWEDGEFGLWQVDHAA